MKKYDIHDFGDGEIEEYEGTSVPKSFWFLVVGLMVWGVYYTVMYLNFIPEALRHVK